jgi:hypothetical protein
VDGNWVEFDLELYDFLEGLRESDLNDGLLIATRNLRSSVRVIVSDGPLLEEVSLLIDHILVKLTVLMRQRIIPLRSENVSTFRISEAFTGFLLVCQIGKIQDCSVNISIFLLHGVVFLEIHTKSLFYALALMIILE